MPYRYACLRPTRAPDSESWNAPILADNCFGIEVTEPELVLRCRFGNLDPQHLGGTPHVSAVEAALELALPPVGAILVTIRPDADAYGAMAVLTLRRRAQALSRAAMARVALIGKTDRFDRGAWAGPRTLPKDASEIDEVGAGPQQIGALHAGLACEETSIEEGIQQTAEWILTGHVTAVWVERANHAAQTLFAAGSSGTIVLHRSTHPSIAVVEGFAPGALRLGYRLAPVIIAEAPSHASGGPPRRKLTIAQYDPSWVDLRGVARALSTEEAGWGGTDTIIGSPQGSAARTPVEQCISILRNQGVRDLMFSAAKGEG
jgi:hypothetical protein